jgi:hypothetical protein
MKKYDSRLDTLLHIKKVNAYLIRFVQDILGRATHHDSSKLVSPEVEMFDLLTPKLQGFTYGSEEYNKALEELSPALKHHYANNSHHPQHFKNGVDDMNLLDLVEMFFDWKASSERHNDGNIRMSLEHNKDRYKLSDQLLRIFENTVDHYGW